MPFFCFIVEPLRDAEGFFDSLCALLERKRIGGDHGDKILSIRVKRLNAAGLRQFLTTIHEGAKIAAQRGRRLRERLRRVVPFGQAAGQVGKLHPIAVFLVVENGRDRL